MRRERSVIEEERFEYKGFPCVILFMDMGWRCGYVGYPDTKTINPDEISCHGGITYGPESHLHLQDDVNTLWIGFDTAHYCDGIDAEKVKEYFGKTANIFNLGGEVRTLEFCKEECKSIVDQLIGIIGE